MPLEQSTKKVNALINETFGARNIKEYNAKFIVNILAILFFNFDVVKIGFLSLPHEMDRVSFKFSLENMVFTNVYVGFYPIHACIIFLYCNSKK